MLLEYCIYRRFFIVLLFILSISCTSQNVSRPTDRFSHISFQNFIGAEYPINYIAKQNELGTLISIEYQFTKSSPDQHYIIQIQFSPAGRILIEADYVKQYEKSLSKNSAEKHSIYFPSVGFAAQYTFLGAGPGGMAEQLIFTSSNKKHDVKIISSHLLANGVEPIPLTLKDFAVYINSELLKSRGI